MPRTSRARRPASIRTINSPTRISRTAVDADARIIYDKAPGKLCCDADGSGSGEEVQFADLGAKTKLAASDFMVGEYQNDVLSSASVRSRLPHAGEAGRHSTSGGSPFRKGVYSASTPMSRATWPRSWSR